MEEPDSQNPAIKDVPEPDYSSLDRSTSRRSTPGISTSGRSTPGKSISGRSTPGRSMSGRSTSGRSTPGRSTSGRSTPGESITDRSTPEPPPVPPATYHWDEVRKQRSVGGYPWTHLDKPPFDENTWVKYERDHVYEPVTPAASTDRISSPTKQTSGPSKDENRHFLRIPLTEELVMADESGSEPESEQRPSEEEEEEDDEDDDDDDDVEGEDDEDEDDDDRGNVKKIKPQSDESIYEGENENSSVGEVDASKTRMKMFQQKCKVKADVLRAKLQGVTKRKPKQKIVVDTPNGEKNRRKFGQFATLPKKFTFNAAKVNFSTAFNKFARNDAADANESGGTTDDAKSGRFSMPRFGRFSRTASESPKPCKSSKIGSSRISIPGLRPRTWSDASKTSKPEGGGVRAKLMEFGTYPRIFSKRRRANEAAAAAKTSTPPPPSPGGDADRNPRRKDSFRRRFFRTHKESTPAPTDKRQETATLAVEEETDEAHVSKESLAEFGDSDLQEVISLSDDCGRSTKDTKSLSEHRPGVIEEIDSDEFFLREKGLSRGNVHISNYLSSEIRDVFRSNRTRSVEGVNGINGNGGGGGGGTATPVRPSRTNSLRRPMRSQFAADANGAATTDRFSTMPKSFGGNRPFDKPAETNAPENIITSQTFEPSQGSAVLPSAFRVPWRKTEPDNAVAHMPPRPPTRQRMVNQRCSTFDTRSMIDLSRKRSQSQSGFLPTMNFSETVPKAPLRRSRTSLAGSDRELSVTSERPWTAMGGGAPTPPLRRSRMSLTTDADAEERASLSNSVGGTDTPTTKRATPPRPPPPSVVAGYATVDKSQASSLAPPQSPMRHRRKKSYEVIKSQEFGAFFTIPRSYVFRKPEDAAGPPVSGPPPPRPARAYNTLGPSRPHRRRPLHREHEYGDVAENDDDGDRRRRRRSIDDDQHIVDDASAAKALFSGDVIEKMKLRPLPSPPPPPRKSKTSAADNAPEPHQRRNTDSALVPFLDRRETSATSSEFFADVSRALRASQTIVATADDVSVGIQTDPLPDGYELGEDDDDDVGSCGDSESSNRAAAVQRPASSALTAPEPVAADRPTSRTSEHGYCVDRPTSRTSEHGYCVDRPTSRTSTEYAIVPTTTDGHDNRLTGVICAQRINVNELEVTKMTVAEILSQRMGVDDVSTARTGRSNGMLPYHDHHVQQQQQQQQQDDALSVHSRISSLCPEVDSDEDRTSVLAAPTPPRRRSKPPAQRPSAAAAADECAVNVSAAVADPSITELSCQLFRLCHSNVCSLFNKVVQQVVPEDTEKRRDLQAALCFLSIILAGLLILGFGNEKTIHHHHWDFQFPPPNH